MSKEVGGLGVRRLKEFNIALLGKWCWRCLMDMDCNSPFFARFILLFIYM